MGLTSVQQTPNKQGTHICQESEMDLRNMVFSGIFVATHGLRASILNKTTIYKYSNMQRIRGESSEHVPGSCLNSRNPEQDFFNNTLHSVSTPIFNHFISVKLPLKLCLVSRTASPNHDKKIRELL